MLPQKLAIVDLETTGITATGDRITEIGIVLVENGRVIEEWQSLVNPECSIPVEIQALTGITDAMVAKAPTFARLARDVLARLDGCLFVAHNARFDYGFIKNAFRRHSFRPVRSTISPRVRACICFTASTRCRSTSAKA